MVENKKYLSFLLGCTLQKFCFLQIIILWRKNSKKKKLLIGTILPALAAAAVIGSGFALWVFNNEFETSKAQDNVTHDITQLVKVGKIDQASPFKIQFDQTANTRPAGFDKVEATGISFVFGDGAKKYAEYVASESTLGTHKGDSTENHFSSDTVNGVIGYEFSVTLSLPSTLASYVDFSFGNKKMEKSVSSDRILYKAKTSDSRKIYWGETTDDLKPYSITASYAAKNATRSMEPTSTAEYKTLHDIIVNLDSDAIVVQYAAQLVSLVK